MPPIPELEQIRKTQILDAALQTISANGSANVTMEEIARTAGLSKGGLAHYFKSKNDLFQSTFKEFFDRIFQRVRKEISGVEGPMEKLLGFELLFDMEDPDAEAGYPLLFDCMLLAVRDETYRALFDEWVNNWVALLRDVIDEGVEQGLFHGVDAEPMARAVSALYQGVATRWYLATGSHSRAWALEYVRKGIRGLMAPYLTADPGDSE
jgi:AcrR family transcriptional regulator